MIIFSNCLLQEDEEEYSVDSGEEEDSEADLAVVVEIVGDRQRGEGAA